MYKRNTKSVYPDQTAIIDYLEKNLTQLLIDTAKMKVELLKIQKEKKQLMEHKFSCLIPDFLEPLPDMDTDLMPRINRVTSQAEYLIDGLSKLNKTCDQQCQETKSCCDQDDTLSSKEKDAVLVEGKKKALKKKKANKKKELANKRKDYQAEHLAMVQEMESLNLNNPNTTEYLKYMTGNALDKVDPTE